MRVDPILCGLLFVVAGGLVWMWLSARRGGPATEEEQEMGRFHA